MPGTPPSSVWQVDDPLVMVGQACKICKKPRGTWCTNSEGKKMTGLHSARRKAYREAASAGG